jgi:hypothetical protein
MVASASHKRMPMIKNVKVMLTNSRDSDIVLHHYGSYNAKHKRQLQEDVFQQRR